MSPSTGEPSTLSAPGGITQKTQDLSWLLLNETYFLKPMNGTRDRTLEQPPADSAGKCSEELLLLQTGFAKTRKSVTALRHLILYRQILNFH